MSAPEGERLTPLPPGKSEPGGTFRALREPSFALFWAGAFISNVGSWFHSVVQGWLVLQLTSSASWLGVVAAASTLPAILFMPIGGVLADRMNRRRLLLSMQVLMLTGAATLGVLTQLGWIRSWHIATLAFLMGTALAFNGPSFSATIKDLTGPEGLPSGVALIGTQFHLSRAVGPFLAAATLDYVGIAGAFYLNAASFVAVIIALVVMRPRFSQPPEPDATPWYRSFAEGFHYVRTEPLTRWMMLLAAAMSLLAMAHATLLPLFAKRVYHVGAEGLGRMMGASGAGAVMGALAATYLAGRFGRVPAALTSAFVTAAGLIGLGLTTRYGTAIAVLVLVGASSIVVATVGLTTVQATVPNRYRGRVMSLYNLAFMGGITVGNLIAGAVAERIGGGPTLVLGGAAFGLSLLGFAARRPPSAATEPAPAALR